MRKALTRRPGASQPCARKERASPLAKALNKAERHAQSASSTSGSASSFARPDATRQTETPNAPVARYSFVATPASRAALEALTDQWRSLAANAAQPNPFFEDWFLLPSLEQFDPANEVILARLYDGEELAGLMPLALERSYEGYPLPYLTNWLHDNMFSGVPLVRPSAEYAFWEHLIAWADSHTQKETFLHLSGLTSDCAVTRALWQVCANQNRACNTVFRENRALLLHGESPEAHLSKAFSKKRRKELGRKRRRLEEEGDFHFTRCRDKDGLDQWISQFLKLEQDSWKGAEGSSLASDQRKKAMFESALNGAAEAGKLERLAFHLGDEPVAMLAQFITGRGAFSFKTSFAEDLASLSPGMLLQVENLSLLDDETIAWCDSCAAPDHPMIDRIWFDRREITRLSVPLGGRLRRFVGQCLTGLEAQRVEARNTQKSQAVANL